MKATPILTMSVVAALAASPRPAPAQASSDTTLEEIIVTAERTDRSLRETTSSVSVASAQDIERRGLATSNDLLEGIPNLVTSEPSNDAPAVRGLNGTGAATGAGAFIAGSRPRLGYLVDGRTLSYNESVFSDASLWDVSQVEVYRGPQSTLQGRNSIAGLIAIRTAEPTFEWEGAARAIVGDHETREYSAALSGPLVDDAVAFRLSGDTRTRQSYIDVQPFTGQNEPGEYSLDSLRGKLLIAPSSSQMRTLVTFTHTEGYEPQNPLATRPFDEYRGQFSTPPQPGRNARFQIRANTGIVDTSWSLNDALTLQAVASAADVQVRRTTDPGRGIAGVDAREYSFEPRMRMSFLDERVKGFLGAFVFRADQDEALDLSRQTPVAPMTFEDSTDTNAVFGEVTFAMTPSVNLVLGARYEEEQRLRTGGLSIFSINFDETYREFLPKASVAWNIDESSTIGVVVGRGYNGGGAGFTFFPPFVTYTFEPEHVLNYELFTRTLLLDNRLAISANVFYNDYSDLQLPFDLNPDPANVSNVIRNADKAETYGLEVSARFAPAKALQLSFDAGVLQTKVTKYPGSGIEGQELARSPGYSLSLGISYLPVESLELNLNGNYSDSYYSDLPNDSAEIVDSYFIANARASYTLGKARVFVSVNNLTDEVVPVSLSAGPVRENDLAILLEPRSVYGGIEFRF